MSMNSLAVNRMKENETDDLIILPDDDDELLAQCEVETFRSTGPGGQHINKTDSAVRITHRNSGVTVISRKERSQYLNKKACIENLRKKIMRLNYREPPRIKTRVPKSAKIKRLEKKSVEGLKKNMRKPVRFEDD